MGVTGIAVRLDATAPNLTSSVPLCRPGRGVSPMLHLMACNLACLMIAALYYTWRDVYLHRKKREKLHERVAYMLWVAAARAA